MHIIERLLCKLFPYVDILRDDTPDIYLRRWFIYPRDKDFGKNKGKGRLYLHKFYRGDDHEEHLHDHPWAFTSLILTRGYWEETPLQHMLDNVPVSDFYKYTGEWISGEQRVRCFYPRFSVLKRPAVWKHRVLLNDTVPVWTIVRTGVKERNWGFWIKGKLCPWRNYNNGVCWCEEGKKDQKLTDQGVKPEVFD